MMGVSWPTLRTAVARGRVVRPVRGTYALPRTPHPLTAAAALRGQVACLSACAHWGLRMLARPRAAHVAVPNNRSLAASRVAGLGLECVHHGTLDNQERRVEPVAAAIDHAAWCATPLEQLVLIDGALNKRMVDPVFPPQLATGAPARVAWLLENICAQSQSVPETVARAVLAAAGLDPQVQVRHEDVGTVDFSVGTRHSIEIDGWEHHGTREAFAEDRRRDREMAAKRKWTLRYTYAGVIRDPRAFGLDVARVVGRSVSARFDTRMAWMLTRPATAFTRR